MRCRAIWEPIRHGPGPNRPVVCLAYMASRQELSSARNPMIARLAALAPLRDLEIAALERACRSQLHFGAHRDIVMEGMPVSSPLIICSGWAAQVRYFADGRRQILGLLLPGELIGLCHRPNAPAASTITAMTDLVVCPAPRPRPGSEALEQAYAVSKGLEEVYLLRQIARLGQLSACERITDLMLEIRERLALAGLADDRSFPMPLTQKVMADILGLTSVHVSRTLLSIRQRGDWEMRNGSVQLSNTKRLEKMVRRATRFTGDPTEPPG